jgi:hypothetical protein
MCNTIHGARGISSLPPDGGSAQASLRPMVVKIAGRLPASARNVHDPGTMQSPKEKAEDHSPGRAQQSAGSGIIRHSVGKCDGAAGNWSEAGDAETRPVQCRTANRDTCADAAVSHRILRLRA